MICKVCERKFRVAFYKDGVHYYLPARAWAKVIIFCPHCLGPQSIFDPIWEMMFEPVKKEV